MPDDPLPPIEVVGASDEHSTSRSTTDTDHRHRTVRTVAAAVAALSLVWVGWSVNSLREDARRERCQSNVEFTRRALEEAAWRRQPPSPRGGPDLDQASVDDLVQMARRCGLDAYADSLREIYAEEDDGD